MATKYSHDSLNIRWKLHLECQLPQEPRMKPLDTPPRPEGKTA
jgi:hypothetical protein